MCFNWPVINCTAKSWSTHTVLRTYLSVQEEGLLSEHSDLFHNHDTKYEIDIISEHLQCQSLEFWTPQVPPARYAT